MSFNVDDNTQQYYLTAHMHGATSVTKATLPVQTNRKAGVCASAPYRVDAPTCVRPELQTPSSPTRQSKASASSRHGVGFTRDTTMPLWRLTDTVN